MWRVKVFLMGLVFPFSIYASTANTNLEAMIYELHQLSALSVITKDYVMVSMQNTFHNPAEDLNKEIDRFNEAQKKLLVLPLDKNLHTVLLDHQDKWKVIELFLKKPINRKSFLELRKYIYPLRSSMRKQIAGMKKILHNEQADIIYYAGKLTAISQEFAGIYLLLKWGTNSNMDKLKVDILIQSSMYIDTLSRLKKITSSNAPLQNILKKLELYFQYLSYLNKSTKTFTPVLVYRKVNMMSKYSNKIMEITQNNGG